MEILVVQMSSPFTPRACEMLMFCYGREGSPEGWLCIRADSDSSDGNTKMYIATFD